jgi:transposase
MEAVYYAARANLRRVLTQHPAWTRKQYAQAVGMSKGWVKKWVKRLQEAPPEDEAVLHSQSRARKHPPERISEVVVDRILQMRDQPPEGLGRTPGPRALLYYLPRDVELAATGQRLPRSSRTIYRLLRQAGRIQRRVPAQHEPPERPAPMSQWQLDAHSMPPPCPPSPTASGSTSSRCSTLSIWGPPSWSRPRCGRTSPPRPPWRWSPSSCACTDVPDSSPSTVMCAL